MPDFLVNAMLCGVDVTTHNVVANLDGNIVSRLEALQQGLARGQAFWVRKSLVSSDITQTGVDVTGLTSDEVSIEDVVIRSDATGLAGMTNFTLTTDNAKGAATFFSTAASGLNANKTVDLAGASGTKHKTVLESGRKVIAKATAADGTGSGTIEVALLCRRVSMGATLAAA